MRAERVKCTGELLCKRRQRVSIQSAFIRTYIHLWLCIVDRHSRNVSNSIVVVIVFVVTCSNVSVLVVFRLIEFREPADVLLCGACQYVGEVGESWAVVAVSSEMS